MKTPFNLNQENVSKSSAMRLNHHVKKNQSEWLGESHGFKQTPLISGWKFLNLLILKSSLIGYIQLEEFFDYNDILENKRVKLVALRLGIYASLWWTNLNAKWLRERKSNIRTWQKMKTKLNARFLPPTYVQDCYSQLYNLTQGDMSIEE